MFIHECLLTTQNGDDTTHIAPMGVWKNPRGEISFAPYRPSSSLDNILRTGYASLSCSDDVSIFTSCVLGDKSRLASIALFPNLYIPGMRLDDVLSHTELKLMAAKKEKLRTRCTCKSIYQANHRPFRGFNRAQSAIIELAILISRLHILPKQKIIDEICYLQIAIDKTAGAVEGEAWNRLHTHIQAYLHTGKARNY